MRVLKAIGDLLRGNSTDEPYTEPILVLSVPDGRRRVELADQFRSLPTSPIVRVTNYEIRIVWGSWDYRQTDEESSKWPDLNGPVWRVSDPKPPSNNRRGPPGNWPPHGPTGTA